MIVENILKISRLEDCARFNVGKIEVLLTSFGRSYQGGFGSESVILRANDKYFIIGYFEKDNILNELKASGKEVKSLEKHIKERIFEEIVKNLDVYVKENKDKQLFNKDDISLYNNLHSIGKEVLPNVKNSIRLEYVGYEDLKDGRLILTTWKDSIHNISHKLTYDLFTDKFYKDDKEVSEEVFKTYCGSGDRNLYTLYVNYINNSLSGENLAYKEIAELNKWLEKDDKSSVTVIYDVDGVEKEGKVKFNNIDTFLHDLPKKYYEEMFSFYGIDEIKTIKQIKGFKYRKDIYLWNIENLLYKKENV